MKDTKRIKLLTAGLLTAAVLVLAVVSAGCVSAPQNQGEQNIDFSALETSVLIDVEKTGTFYNIGDTAELLIPGNPSRGIAWEVAECPDGIAIEEGLFIPADPQKPDGSGTQTFIITALKEGDHNFVLLNPAVNGKYADTLQVRQTGDEPMNPRSVFAIMQQKDSVTCTGQAYAVSIAGKPSEGYIWETQKTEGLLISEPEFVPDGDMAGITGADGHFLWKVTSFIPGEYRFVALLMHECEKEPVGSVVVLVIFKESSA